MEKEKIIQMFNAEELVDPKSGNKQYLLGGLSNKGRVFCQMQIEKDGKMVLAWGIMPLPDFTVKSV